MLIAEEQISLASQHVQVVNQEQNIALLQAQHATAITHYLGNKFTNAELYSWMSNILESVYRYFLQQATSTAHLAAST